MEAFKILAVAASLILFAPTNVAHAASKSEQVDALVLRFVSSEVSAEATVLPSPVCELVPDQVISSTTARLEVPSPIICQFSEKTYVQLAAKEDVLLLLLGDGSPLRLSGPYQGPIFKKPMPKASRNSSSLFMLAKKAWLSEAEMRVHGGGRTDEFSVCEVVPTNDTSKNVIAFSKHPECRAELIREIEGE